MSAVRKVRNIKPAVLATSYRFFDGKPHRLEPRTVPRKTTKPRELLSGDTSSTFDDSPALSGEDNCTTEVNDAYTSDETDEDYDYDFEEDLKSNERNESSGEDAWLFAYLTMCRKLNLLPIPSLKTGLKGKDLTLKFTKLGSSELTALCVAIKRSHTVKELNLEDNAIGPDGGELLAQAIDDNEYLTSVRIVSNNLLVNGLKSICTAVVNALNLAVVDLSDNGITEVGAEYISEMITRSESLQELYLGKNNIMPQGTKVISKALMAPSCSLRVLDLSWNHIRLTGSKAIGVAIEKNKSLEKVNLAWNGLHMEGAVAIRDALRKNVVLGELDLTCNRLTEQCIEQILIGLKKNTRLEIIRLGKNHLTSKGALRILQFIRENKKSGLKVFDLGTQEVNESFVSLYQEILQERDILVVYGPVNITERKSLPSCDICKEEREILRCDPLTVLMECMRLGNYRLLEAFHRMRKHQGHLVDLNELCDRMLQCKVPLKKSTVMEVLEKLDTDGDHMLDYKELVRSQDLHQEVVRQYLLNRSKFEETDVGKISMLLCKLMNIHFVPRISKEITVNTEVTSYAERCKSKGSRIA